MYRPVTFILVFAVPILTGLTATAESRFGTVMKKKYELRSVSCYSCHVKGEEKTVLNPFGKVIDKLVEGSRFSERIQEVKEASSEERQKVYAEVEKEFHEILKKLDTMKADSGKTYAEVISAGEIEGTKLRN